MLLEGVPAAVSRDFSYLLLSTQVYHGENAHFFKLIQPLNLGAKSLSQKPTSEKKIKPLRMTPNEKKNQGLL